MTFSNGIYQNDGTIRTTTVPGTSWTGLQAPDGSINIVLDDTTHYGLYHPCGAWRVSSTTGYSIYDPSGAYYLNTLLGGAGLPAGYAYKLDGSGNYVLDGSGSQILVRT